MLSGICFNLRKTHGNFYHLVYDCKYCIDMCFGVLLLNFGPCLLQDNESSQKLIKVEREIASENM